MKKTLSAEFVARARKTMEMGGINVVAYKRQMGLGSGEEIDLVFSLDALMFDLDAEDLEEMESLCPSIYKDNATQEYYFNIDCVPIYLDKIAQEDIAQYYKNLLKIQRRLRKLVG